MARYKFPGDKGKKNVAATASWLAVSILVWKIREIVAVALLIFVNGCETIRVFTNVHWI